MRGLRSHLPVTVAFGVAALALVFWVLTGRAVPAALRALPPPERAALAERTLANLREICHQPDRPRDFCREQATVVLSLPECDEACRQQARAELMADSAVK